MMCRQFIARRVSQWARVAPVIVITASLGVVAMASADPVSNSGRGGPVTLNQGLSVGPDGEGKPTNLPAQGARAEGGNAVGNREETASSPRTRGRTEGTEARHLPAGRDLPWYRTGFGALAVVLALIGALAWAVRRWVPAARVCDGNLVRVVGRAAISPKHNVALVHVGRRFVLVGVCGDRMSTLCELGDPEEVAELTARANLGPVPATTNFDALLREHAREVGPRRVAAAGDVPAAPNGGPRRGVHELLHRLRALQTSPSSGAPRQGRG